VLAVFEDGNYESFYPLSLTRPLFELKCGSTSLYEKITASFPRQKVIFFTRGYLADTLRARTGCEVNTISKREDILLINGAWLFYDACLTFNGEEEAVFCSENNELLYARIKKRTIDKKLPKTLPCILRLVEKSLKKKYVSGQKIIRRPWELVEENPSALRKDFKNKNKSGIHCEFPAQSALIGKEKDVYIHKTARIYPNVVIDASSGPVTIDENALISPGTWIQGPSYIGKGTHVFGAKIREGVSAGPVCRLGGEIEESIIHGYTNKYHDGFLGHSYLGEFINLGAGTITSDLRVDYGKTNFYYKGKFRPTGLSKVGAFIGDHTKTGVTSVINTASSLGVLSIVLGVESVIPRFIPSFSWYIKKKITKGFGFNKLLESADAQMKRRNRHLSEDDIKMLNKVYEITKPEREAIFKLYSSKA
jgi:UDP-N-acetylglucosamine diphosphorylase / glucose-1-phosphate thymidylyltransferase / UDP-N-acetylgalactosamine diphosphorylase / glucosamine-1-phosphate N-acetyltransferase / galactosamine-1-phosphate N-acetyltransferase